MWTINSPTDLEVLKRCKPDFAAIFDMIDENVDIVEEIEGGPISKEKLYEYYFGGNFLVLDFEFELYRQIPIWEAVEPHMIEWEKFESWDSISACGRFIALFFATNNSGGPTLFVPISIAKRSRITKLAQFAESVEMAANEIRIDDNTLRVTRFNPIKGQNQTKDLNITPEQWEKYQRGTLIQNALGHLSANDREFIITGIGDDDDWDSMFTEEEKQ